MFGESEKEGGESLKEKDEAKISGNAGMCAWFDAFGLHDLWVCDEESVDRLVFRGVEANAEPKERSSATIVRRMTGRIEIRKGGRLR